MHRGDEPRRAAAPPLTLTHTRRWDSRAKPTRPEFRTRATSPSGLAGGVSSAAARSDEAGGCVLGDQQRQNSTRRSGGLAATDQAEPAGLSAAL